MTVFARAEGGPPDGSNLNSEGLPAGKVNHEPVQFHAEPRLRVQQWRLRAPARRSGGRAPQPSLISWTMVAAVVAASAVFLAHLADLSRKAVLSASALRFAEDFDASGVNEKFV